MTAPLPDDPFEGMPVSRRIDTRLLRDVAGLVLVIGGLGVLFYVAATVDMRLMWALWALVLIGGGFALGRSNERG